MTAAQVGLRDALSSALWVKPSNLCDGAKLELSKAETALKRAIESQDKHHRKQLAEAKRVKA